MRNIVVVSYDPEWPALFEQERQRIEAALKPFEPTIDHVGSTAVEGLAAKPVIDFSIALGGEAALDCSGEDKWQDGSEESLQACGSARHKSMVEAVCNLGYQYRGEHGIPGRPFFAKDVNGVRKCNLHVSDSNHPNRLQQLAFRDYLRKRPDVVTEYGRIKLEGSKLYPNDIGAYMEHKDPFIKRVMSEITT